MIMKHEIDVPKGCKVISVEIISVETTDKMVVVKFEKEDPEFKENDIVYTVYNNHPCISVINNWKFDDGMILTKCSFDIDANKGATICTLYIYDTIRLATDSEKQLLFDKLKEKCLMFDGENIVRWRSNVRCNFYYLSGNSMVMNAVECGHNWQNSAYESGNYFPTRELAEAYQKVYIESLNNFHKNL